MATDESLFEEDCGRTLEQFVFGGELAAAGAFPFLVSFVNQRDGREIGRGTKYLHI
jgi:secreted trypsin-like serine protease